MSIKPILFNTDMVQAILDGRKTATRRLVRPHNRKKAKEQGYFQGNGLLVDPSTDNGDKEGHVKDYSISPYQPGDILYVRETWAFATCINCDGDYRRKGAPAPCYDTQAVEYDDGDSISDGCFIYKAGLENPERIIWRPSIHMPKQAARLWIKVTDVRLERLQEMKVEDCIEEGAFVYLSADGWFNRDVVEAEAKRKFGKLWDSTIKKTDISLYGWDANPWVWVIEFERCRADPSADYGEYI